MAYSMDLRERVLALYDEGLKTKKVAERLKVCPAWARRIKQWRNAGKSIAPRPVGGSKPKLDEAARQRLARFVDERPDATLEELRARVAAELGISISIGALWETLRAMKLSLKKSRWRRASSRGRTWRRGAGGVLRPAAEGRAAGRRRRAGRTRATRRPSSPGCVAAARGACACALRSRTGTGNC